MTLTEKYGNIEDKIPSVWKDYETAGIELAQDLWQTWNVQDGELIRVIALVGIRVPRLKLSKHIDQRFSFAGLYPEKIKKLDILPQK